MLLFLRATTSSTPSITTFVISLQAGSSALVQLKARV
jgi:hypothetical protein